MDNVVTMDTRKRRKEGAARAPSLESLQVSPKRARVHAQRKFAQGSQPNSPAPTPVKETRELRDRSNSADTRSRAIIQPHTTPPPPPPPLDIVEVPIRPTVEDFLTFLCYRGTPLLPPELEHFNTPQLLETPGDSRSQSPARDEKVRSSTKKKQDGLILDKRERELSKEAVRKNLEQSTDIEDTDTTPPPVRVTRSSTYPPPASSTSVSDHHLHSPQKGSKRLMIKKALLLRSKSKSLRIQERREMSLRKLDKQIVDSSIAQGTTPVISTRSGRLLHKYRVSATTAMARKKAKVAKLKSMRPKQKLSRILQRLGGSVTHPDTKLTRITRSQVEAKEELSAEKLQLEEEPTAEAKKLNNNLEESTAEESAAEVSRETTTKKLTRPVRPLGQQVDEKKVFVKKVLGVDRKTKAAKESSCPSSKSSSDSQCLSLPEADEAPMSRRLRKKSSAASSTSLDNSDSVSPTNTRYCNSRTSDDAAMSESDSPGESKDSEKSEKANPSTPQKLSESSCSLPAGLSATESPKADDDSSCSDVQGCLPAPVHPEESGIKSKTSALLMTGVSQSDASSAETEPHSSTENTTGDVETKVSTGKKKLSLESEKCATKSLLEIPPAKMNAVDTEKLSTALSSITPRKASKLSEESLIDSSSSTPQNKRLTRDSKKKDPLLDVAPHTKSSDESLTVFEKPSATPSANVSSKKSCPVPEEKVPTSAESASISQNKPLTKSEKLESAKEANSEKLESAKEATHEKKPPVTSLVDSDSVSPSSATPESNLLTVPESIKEDLSSEISMEKDISSNPIPTALPTSNDSQAISKSDVGDSSVSHPKNLKSDDVEENDIVKSASTPPKKSSQVSPVDNSQLLKSTSTPPKKSSQVPPVDSSPVLVSCNGSKSASSSSSVRASQRKSSTVQASTNANKKAAVTRETRRSRDSVTTMQVTSGTSDEVNTESGIRTRPSRRTKEAATVYLELIGRKLAKESNSKDDYEDDDDDEEDDDDDAVSVSSIMDLKDLAKSSIYFSEGRDNEKERNEKLSSWKADTAIESIMEDQEVANPPPEKSKTVNTSSMKYNTRRSPRQKRDLTELAMEEEEKEIISRRRSSREESASLAVEASKPLSNVKAKRKLEKEDSFSPERTETKTSTAEDSSSINEALQSGQTPAIVTRAGMRNLRRTRSDAEEPRRKGSRPSSRRSSLEIDTIAAVTRQKLNNKGRQCQSYVDNSGSEEEESIQALKFASFLSDSKSTNLKIGRTVAESDEVDDKKCKNVVVEKSNCLMTKDQVGAKSEEDNLFESKVKETSLKDEKDSCSDKEAIEKEVNKSKKPEVVENKNEKENDEKKDKMLKCPSVCAASGNALEIVAKSALITGKTHRTVLQERKTRKVLSKDGGGGGGAAAGRTLSGRKKSLERRKSGVSSGSGDDGCNDVDDKKTTRPAGRQKVVGVKRRRSSNHDEVKLNEVLESVAKDFERDLDEDHYDQLEKDFVLGNKSPDKGGIISEKMIELSEKDDSSLSEFINFCMDDKISCNIEAFDSSGSVKTPSDNGTSQPGSSSPNLSKRSASGKKLSDVVRSLQKKQAESPSTVGGAPENLPFLKDLNTWNSDKLRQVSPQSGSFHLESPNTSSAPKVISQSDTSMPEIVHITNPGAALSTTTTTTNSPPAEIITTTTTTITTTTSSITSFSSTITTTTTTSTSTTSTSTTTTSSSSSKALSPVPDIPITPKVAFTNSSSIGPLPTNSPVTSHSSPSVVTVTTSCLQANAPYTAVTYSASYNVVYTSTAPIGTSPTTALACDSQAVNAVSKSSPLKSFQTSKDEQVTVFSSIPVAVNPPPTTVNVLSSGFSSTSVSCLPKLTSSVNLSSLGSNAVACAKSVELTAQKPNPKQLHIAPKPSRSATPLATSSITNQLPLPMLPQGAVKQIPKPVQIAPKPPAPATHVHPNSQILTHQPSHLMQTQVQTQMQALPQQIQGVKAIPQAVQTIPALPPQPVQNMQALSQTVQTMQAIPQPVQSMHTIPQAVQTVPPQPIQTMQTLAPPMQTVTGVPVQAVITQTVNPTHIVPPSSPAKIISHPVFATSSNQSTVTYTLAPHSLNQNQLQTNVGAVARVLAPTVVGKVATKQPNLMTPKPPDSLVTIPGGAIGNAGSIRPIVPLPQQVQVTQPQILAVNVLPVVSTAVVGQGGLIARPQASVVPSCHVSGNHSFVPATTVSNEIPTQSHNSLAFSQHLPLSNSSASYVPTNAVVATFPLQSSGISINTPQSNHTSCETLHAVKQPPRSLAASNPTSIKTVGGSIKTTPNPHNPQGATPNPHNPQGATPNPHNPQGASGNLQTPVTGTTVARTYSGVSNGNENVGQVGAAERKINSSVSTATNSIVEAAFKGSIPASVKIAEAPKASVKTNGPVSFVNAKSPSKVPAVMKPQLASSSITITPLGEVSHASGNSSTPNFKPVSSVSQGITGSDLAMKLPAGVSVVHHKAGVARTVSRTPFHSESLPCTSQTTHENNNSKAICSTVGATEKARTAIPSQLHKDDVYNSFIASSGPPKFEKDKVSNLNAKIDNNLCLSREAQFRSNKDVSVTAYTTCTDKNKVTHPSSGRLQDCTKLGDRLQSVSSRDPNEYDKRNADRRKEPLLKRTLFKTKSQEERRPCNPSPVYRTKSHDDKKPSGAFSPLHESSVYAFDEPDMDSPNLEVSPFSQRIKNIQSSPGTSPVKPSNAAKPLNQLPLACKPMGKVSTASRCHVARSITPLITGKPKSGLVGNASIVSQSVACGKKITSCHPKAVSTGTDTSVNLNKSNPAPSIPTNEQSKAGAESEQGSEANEGIKKNCNSASIAIQCDMDENIIEESIRANESSTQTDGPSKFPLPPSASPFYYLPLAMAALGEKLPAQLVQQMLAKTQGLVGAAEAGMILQQAAQLAQQHQQKLSQQGTPGGPCLAASSSATVKPIKPASVAPLISGLSSNPVMVSSSVNPSRSVSKYQDPFVSGTEVTTTTTTATTTTTSTTSTTTTTSNTTCSATTLSTTDASIIATGGNTVAVSSSESIAVTSSSVISLTAPSSQVTTTTSSSAPVITTAVTPVFTSSSLTSNTLGNVNNTDPPPSHIPLHRPQPVTTIASSEVTSAPVNKNKPLPKVRKSRGKEEDLSKSQSDDSNPPTRRRSGRATTLAATRATESDMHEIEELRRNRRAKRAAAALAKEEGWSSSSEAPLSPQMSPDTLRGWPPSRLTSPTPSQSSEGTTSSTPSQRGNRMSASRSRRQSPASNFDTKNHASSSVASNSTSQASSSSSTPVTPDKNLEESLAYVCDNSLLVRAPSFYPSEEEFSDPLDYIEKIRPEAEQFGVCRIVPPNSFKPECRVNDDMRFTSNNQYIHKMMKRWGPNVRTLHAIKRCLARQNIELNSNPLIGCMELDLVRLYEVVEQHGGLMSVIEKDMWGKVADACRIPRSAQERLAKLDSIYVKYLLPYATLSVDERSQLLAEVDASHSRSRVDHSLSGRRTTSVTSDNEEEEEEESLDCIVKGKSTALSTFYRVARNISTQWQPDPLGMEVDERYWSLIVNGAHHVCVLSASIDTSEHAYGFPNHRNSPLAKHPWNLKNLCQNPNSVLRSMGTIVGVTAPTLHVGMLFSTVCWYKDPHSLPWIEYLHTGASKIWYGVAANQEDKLCAALKKIVPDYIKDSAIWLPSDTAMVPPTDLVREGVRVCRVVQEPGQFVVVFAGSFTSSVCKGYLISESAFFARPQYFDRAVASFKALHECCEPSMFSLDRLVLSVVSDPRATLDGLLRARELVLQVVEKEKNLRSQLADIGLETSERLSTPDSHRKKKNRFIEDEEENMCEVCRQNLYVALVTNSQEEAVYCLEHALLFLSKNPSHLEYCKLMYTYSLSELDSAVKIMDDRINSKSGNKKSPYSKKSKFREHFDSYSSTSNSNL